MASVEEIIGRASRMAPHDAAVFIGYYIKHDLIRQKTIAVMRRSHSGLPFNELVDAIERARKLWDDCNNYCAETYATDEDYGTVDRAIEKAKVDNPGFSDDSYERVSTYFEFVLR